MVKNPPANAGDAGSIPGPETWIPRVSGQLSLLSRACRRQPEKSRDENLCLTAGAQPPLAATKAKPV